jgi:WD40 repeat protein
MPFLHICFFWQLSGAGVLSTAYLAAGGADGALHICDVRKLASAADPDRLQPVQTFRSHRCSVLHAVFDTQHPGLLATADEDARIFVWDLELTVKAQEDLLSPPQVGTGLHLSDIRSPSTVRAMFCLHPAPLSLFTLTQCTSIPKPALVWLQLRMIHPGHASDVLAMAWCPAPGSAPCMASLSAAWGEDYTLQVRYSSMFLHQRGPALIRLCC